MSLRQGRHGHDSARRAGTPYLLEIHKKERAILDNRAAKRKAALVALAVWLGVEHRTPRQILGIKEIARVDPGALQEIPAAAVERVGSALHHHVDHGAAVVAELRREAVVLDFHFLHALDQRLVINVRVSSFALFRRAEQRTVQPYLGGCVALPVGCEVCSRRIVIARAGPRHFGHTRRQKGQAEKAAVDQRQFVHILAADVRAQCRALGVEQWRGLSDLHRFADAQGMQHEVNAGLLIDLQHDVLFFHRTKAFSLAP